MGGSSSKSSAELVSNTLIVNETDMNMLNKTVNDVAVSAVIKNAKDCSAAVALGQTIGMGDLNIGAGASADISQDQSATLDFSCLQQDDVQLDIINQMSQTINQALQNTTNTDVLDKLSAAVEAKGSSDMGIFPWPSTGGSNSDTSISQTVNKNIKNTTKVNLQNIVENSTASNFASSTVSSCLGKIAASQTQTYGNVTLQEGANLKLSQSQAAAAVVKCIQQANIAQKTLATVAAFAGVKLAVVNTTKTESIMEAEAKSSAETKGISSIIDSVGGVMSGVVDSVFKGFGSLFGGGGGGGGGMSTIISVICCCCICCLLLLMLLGGGGWFAYKKYGPGASDLAVENGEAVQEVVQEAGKYFFGNYLSECQK